MVIFYLESNHICMLFLYLNCVARGDDQLLTQKGKRKSLGLFIHGGTFNSEFVKLAFMAIQTYPEISFIT